MYKSRETLNWFFRISVYFCFFRYIIIREISGKCTGDLRDMFGQHIPLVKPFVAGHFRGFTGNVGTTWYPASPCQEPRPLDGWGMDNHPLNPENPWSLNVNLGSERSVWRFLLGSPRAKNGWISWRFHLKPLSLQRLKTLNHETD